MKTVKCGHISHRTLRIEQTLNSSVHQYGSRNVRVTDLTCVQSVQTYSTPGIPAWVLPVQFKIHKNCGKMTSRRCLHVKQECIPVGCVAPAPYRTREWGEGSLPWILNLVSKGAWTPGVDILVDEMDYRLESVSSRNVHVHNSRRQLRFGSD